MATSERLSRAERRARTRDDLVDAAERLFSANGFHATSVDAVADAAGYTKGAVYSNFASKEDLFLAVYARQADQAVAAIERELAKAPDPITGIETLARARVEQRGRADGWLAVFFEFWAHVVRRPELRDRFARIHRRALEPMAAAVERFAGERGISIPVEAGGLNVAMNAMVLGLSLERLTQPDVVDVRLGARMVRLVLEDLERGGFVGASEDRKE
jgi:AcrR family transcriptional regulator